ncbi:MAG: hypothetical protein AMXMBFR47_17400 [Planctomycetota bacterium]
MNPFVWLSIQIGGGYKSIAYICAGFLALVFGVYWVVTSAEAAASPTPAPGAAPRVVTGPPLALIWLLILSIAQGVFLLLMAPGAIRKAVMRDFQSGMIESHRISPLGNWRMTLGYMTGPPVTAFCLYVTAVLCGMWFVAQAGGGLGPAGVGALTPANLKFLFGGWLGAQLLFVILSFMLAAATLLTSLGTSGKHNLIGTVVLLVALASWAILPLVPGIALLLGVMSAMQVIGLFSTTPSLDAVVPATAAGLNVAFGLLFLWAASERLRRPDQPLLSPLQSLCFSLAVATTLALGLSFADRMGDRFFEDADFRIEVRIIASCVVLMLVGLVLCSACATEAVRLDRAAALGQSAGVRRRWLAAGPLAQTAILLGLLVASVLAIGETTASAGLQADYLSTGRGVRALSIVAVSSFSAFYFCYAWYYWLLAAGRKGWVATLLIVAIFAIPVGADAFISAAADEARVEWAGRDYLSSLSPVGTLILESRNQDRPALAGIAVQVALTLVVLLLMQRSRERVAIPVARVGVG